MINEKKQIITLLNNINNNFSKNASIKSNESILISISSGQDSISVFFIFLHLKRQWRWSFGIIYNNHLWQKNGFFASNLVVQLAYIFKIPIYCVISSKKIFNENQSRYWRYNTFYRISYFYNYKLISTGHTSSDKVETIIFQLMRGTSSKSLTSFNFVKHFLSTSSFSKNVQIKTQYLYNYTFTNLEYNPIFSCFVTQQIFCNGVSLQIALLIRKKALLLFQNSLNLYKVKQRNKPKTYKLFHQNYLYKTFSKQLDKLSLLLIPCLLVRPVLNLHRFDLQKLLNFWKLPIYPDKSNKKNYYYRNRIRKQLLPTLKFFFNPQIDIILLQFSEILTAEQTYLEIVTNRLKYDFYTKNNSIFQLNIELFYSIPLAIQRKLVKKFLKNFTYKQIYFFQIEYILRSITKEKISILNKFQLCSSFIYLNKKYLIAANSNSLYLSQFYWAITYNKQKKKITVLNLYFLNSAVYKYFITPKALLYKYINFFKKNFFLLSANNFFYKFYSFNTLKKKIHFSLYYTICVLNKQANKQNRKIRKNKIERKNTFNFTKLTEKTNYLNTKTRYNQSKLNGNKILKVTILYNELFNFLSYTCYFQEFKIFFYPELGIFVYFRKKIYYFKVF